MKAFCIAAFAAASLLTAPAAFAEQFDQDVTNNVIMGTGITNGSWTTGRDNGVELGLRGKLRYNAAGSPENTFNSNGDGTYSFDAGVAPTQSSPTAVWSFEWSINSNFDGSGGDLDGLTYKLSWDSDPSLGTSFASYDPINSGPADHAIGDNTTAQSAGTKATSALDYANLIANNNLAQNSWKAHWYLSPFDPTVDGTYDFKLEAFGDTGLMTSTSMQIIVGAGGQPVPEPATLGLLALGFVGIARARRRRRTTAS